MTTLSDRDILEHLSSLLVGDNPIPDDAPLMKEVSDADRWFRYLFPDYQEGVEAWNDYEDEKFIVGRHLVSYLELDDLDEFFETIQDAVTSQDCNIADPDVDNDGMLLHKREDVLIRIRTCLEQKLYQENHILLHWIRFKGDNLEIVAECQHRGDHCLEFKWLPTFGLWVHYNIFDIPPTVLSLKRYHM